MKDVTAVVPDNSAFRKILVTSLGLSITPEHIPNSEQEHLPSFEKPFPPQLINFKLIQILPEGEVFCYEDL